MFLEKIEGLNDVKKLPERDLVPLADEIRTFLIQHIAKTGGHLASNLGVVDLTIALHRAFDLPKDHIIWDVGHQCYTHKILSGRKNQFQTLRQYKGLSGFPKREEDMVDSFDTGHSSNSISAGMGFVAARNLQHGDDKVVVVIGDGAMTGGIAFEALNNAAMVKGNFIIVLNDNKMSISENVGGMSTQLSKLRTGDFYRGLKRTVYDSLEKVPGVGGPMIRTIRKTKDGLKQLLIPGMFFEEMGITYLGPVDGHNISKLIRTFQEAKKVDGPVLVHAVTTKGKGYDVAMRHPARFHSTGAFDIETGLGKKGKPGYTDVFSTVMKKMGARDEKVVAITAAMEDGTGLKRFHNCYPERFFDVGIAEQHAVTFAAGLAVSGYVPVFAVYSSFLQRGFDEVAQDVCMQNLHVVFAIDRAGLVGNDGPTHHGVFDLAYLTMLPNMTVMAPKNIWELSDMLKFAIAHDGPIALRYPRGEAFDGEKEHRAPIEMGKAELLYQGEKVCLMALGAMVKVAVVAAEQLAAKGMKVTVVNLRFAKPLDYAMIEQMAQSHTHIVTMEDHMIHGGVGVAIADYLKTKEKTDAHIYHVGIGDSFVEQGSVPQLYKECGMDAESVCALVENIWKTP
ncbi:MAG: 1-deoxy-D-xylulose-5-phosphate synthase [Lachnospiraceae bacterium]|jgi:1-deoxy-D-xylulose-5-phosphate synthase|nr:1-deoxy-D-xylulose-5-phosphate synthase [Lachnospiraceae bacterium]